jgi:hypothetical protein
MNITNLKIIYVATSPEDLAPAEGMGAGMTSWGGGGPALNLQELAWVACVQSPTGVGSYKQPTMGGDVPAIAHGGGLLQTVAYGGEIRC